MRFFPTVIHGVADYVVGLVGIASPSYFGLTSFQRFAFSATGMPVVVYSLAKDYELGLFRHLRVRFHVLLDAVFGIAMLASPHFLHLPADANLPAYMIGLLAVVRTVTTEVRASFTQSHLFPRSNP
jgi:hypothetical protein